MKHRNAIVFFSLVTCLNLGSAVARAEEGLTLEGAIARSLAGNASVQSKGHAVAVAKGRLKEALAPTDARLGAQVSLGQNVAPIDEDDLGNNYSDYGILVDGQVSRSLNSSLWVEKLFSFGLSAKLSLVADRGNDEASIAEGSIPPQYEYRADPAARTYSGADLELSLPILKAFEDSLNGNNIDAATYYLEQQRSELEDLVSRTILEVADAYWEYTIAYMYYRNLLESAARLKERERNLVSMVTAGVAPKTEMIRMQASLAKKNTDIILAKASARSALTALAQLMGSSSQEAETYAAPADLFPDDFAFAGKGEVSDTLDDAFIRGAVMNRADIKALRNQASAAETRMRITEIDSRPDLNIFGNAGYRGTTYDDSGAGYFKAFTENVRGLNYSVGIYFRAALPNIDNGELIYNFENILVRLIIVYIINMYGQFYRIISPQVKPLIDKPKCFFVALI